MACMFNGCTNFKVKGLEHLDVSNVTDMARMFAGCKKFNCDLSDWDVSNVTDMYSMFTMCENFKGKGLENWDVSKVKNTNYMFAGCDKITIPKWYKKYNF